MVRQNGRQRRGCHERPRPSPAPGRARPHRDREPRRDRGIAAHAAASDPAARLRQRASLQEVFRRGGREPGRSHVPRRPRQVPVHGQGRPPPQLPLRHVRGAAGTNHPHPCLERHHRHSHRRGLHEERPRHLGRPGRPLPARRRRPPRRYGAHRLRLWALHRRPRPPRRRREARLHRGPGVGRVHRASGGDDLRLRAAGHRRHAVLHAGDRRRVRAPGPGPAALLSADRHSRRRTVD